MTKTKEELIIKWENSAISFDDAELLIDLLIAENKRLKEELIALDNISGSDNKKLIEIHGTYYTKTKKLTNRSRRQDPVEGDELYEINGSRMIIVDRVKCNEIAYRVTDGKGGLINAYRVTLDQWRKYWSELCQ